MTRYPPRLPRPGAAHLSFRTPPEPGITGPASGFCMRACCRVPYCSSLKYSSTSFVNSRVSMKLNIARVYGLAVPRQNSAFPRRPPRFQQRSRLETGGSLIKVQAAKKVIRVPSSGLLTEPAWPFFGPHKMQLCQTARDALSRDRCRGTYELSTGTEIGGSQVSSNSESPLTTTPPPTGTRTRRVAHVSSFSPHHEQYFPSASVLSPHDEQKTVVTLATFGRCPFIAVSRSILEFVAGCV